MSKEELMDYLTEEQYMEYWVEKGTSHARNTQMYKQLSKEKEEKFNMIIEMTVPWQRDLVAQIIDNIRSIENARSSMEMDSTIKLIYEDNLNRIN